MFILKTAGYYADNESLLVGVAGRHGILREHVTVSAVILS